MEQRNTRKYALDILLDIERNKAFSNIAINKHLKDKKLDIRDSGLITEIVYGVIENKMYLDFIIKSLAQRNLGEIDEKILMILRMGLYQMIFLDKIPVSAAVNESVKLAKKVNFKTSGFVNAVLRNYLRKKEEIKIPSLEENPIQYLSITYSHPEWMVEKWIKEFGEDFTEELLKANNETPKLTIRTNTLKLKKMDLEQELLKEKVGVQDGEYLDEALRISNAGNIQKMTSFQKGYFQIQDESSMLVAHVMDPKPGELIVDVCAAPGGKTTHIAQRMENKGRIIARDIYDHKLKLISDTAHRLGITIIETQQYNAQEVDQKLFEKADRVLVDAPCSGLGIIRHKPEIKYTKTPDDTKHISKLQLEILFNASKYVKKGGYLVYSTCTIEREENSEVVEKFLKQTTDFQIDDINELLPEKLRNNEKYLQLYPNIHKIDGFFICRLRKKL